MDDMKCVTKSNYRILYEIPARILIGLKEQPIMLAGNGASAYLILIKKLLGEENIATFTLKELKNPVRVAKLSGKVAGICYDPPEEIIKHKRILEMLISDNLITAKIKSKNQFQFKNRAVLIFVVDELPKITNKTHEFWKKWLIVEFNKDVEESQLKQLRQLGDEERKAFFAKIVNFAHEVSSG